MKDLYSDCCYSDEEIIDEQGDYAIYLRKSRADIEAEAKGEGETLARHKKILLELAKNRKIKIGKIYTEIVSGETIEARPKMQKLLADVKKGMWKGVLVVEVERLARGETMDQGLVSKAFKISNTKIVTPMKTYEPDNEFDEEYFEFGLFMSRREYKVINRRLQRGRRASVSEGKYVGSIPPYGYDKVKIKTDKGYTLKENSESSTVKIIFNLYAYEHLSVYEIAKKLDTMNLKPRKSKEWSVATIKEILSNPVYIGKLRWDARKEVKIYKNEKLVKTRPRNEKYIQVKGLHKSIIDEKTWNIAQTRRKLNSVPVAHNEITQNPLAGIVYCGKCGKKMQRKPYKGKNAIIYCTNPECNNIASKLYLVEEKIIEVLKIWLEAYEFNYKGNLENIKKSKIKNIENSIKILNEEIKKENEKLTSIFSFLEDGTYSKEIFKIRKEAVEKNITKINKTIKEYKHKLSQEIAVKKQNKPTKIENIMDIYYILKNAEEKNEFLKSILIKVTYLKTEKAIKADSDPTKFVLKIYPKIKNRIKENEKSK